MIINFDNFTKSRFDRLYAQYVACFLTRNHIMLFYEIIFLAPVFAKATPGKNCQELQ